MMKKLLKFLDICFDIVIYSMIVVFLIIIVIVGLNKFNNRDDIPSFFGYYVFHVATGSMHPELKVDDFVLVKEAKTYEVGDIVTYEMNDVYITHRIYEMNDDEIITKGDANNSVDDGIMADQIKGVVVRKLIIISFIYKLLVDKYILIFLILLIATIVSIKILIKKE